MNPDTVKGSMEDITNRIARPDRFASETAVVHVGLPDAAARDLETVCRHGAPVTVTSRGTASGEFERDAAAVVADFCVLARKGTMSTAIPSGAFIDRGQIAIMTGLAQPPIYEALMSCELPCEYIDGQFLVRYDDLVAFMETPHGTNGHPPRKAGVVYVLATGKNNLDAAKAAAVLVPVCGNGAAVEFRNICGAVARLEPETAAALAGFLRRLAMARMVTVLPKHARLTPDQAGAVVGAMPHYLDQILASGELRSIEADDGHIVRYSDLMAYDEAYYRRAREGMKELQRLGEEMRIEMEEGGHHAAAARRGTSLP
ncbi:MAG: hypothetical protein OXI95_11940 [bacterium]|nr:hypothetical protein [bacterium]MDE0417631.1 hypothetical protein [bacterium]